MVEDVFGNRRGVRPDAQGKTMNNQTAERLRYTVSVYEVEGDPSVLRFTFVPKGLQQARRHGELPKPVPQYIASVRGQGDKVAFVWDNPPERATREELEQIARDRLSERAAWIRRVSELIETVEKWAKELDWSTKRIGKRLEDPRIGNHKVSALIMQEDTVRILLEPVSASAPESLGLVDLYLMPGYDDIANLYFWEGAWHIHYVFPSQKTVADNKKAGTSQPLSKKTLGVVLAEMKKHGQ